MREKSAPLNWTVAPRKCGFAEILLSGGNLPRSILTLSEPVPPALHPSASSVELDLDEGRTKRQWPQSQEWAIAAKLNSSSRSTTKHLVDRTPSIDR